MLVASIAGAGAGVVAVTSELLGKLTSPSQARPRPRPPHTHVIRGEALSRSGLQRVMKVRDPPWHHRPTIGDSVPFAACVRSLVNIYRNHDPEPDLLPGLHRVFDFPGSSAPHPCWSDSHDHMAHWCAAVAE
jgi:hypothetical protein